MELRGNRAAQGRQVVSLFGTVPHQLFQLGQLAMDAVDGLRVRCQIAFIAGDHKAALSGLGVLRQRKQVGEGQTALLSVFGKLDIAPQCPHVRVRHCTDRQKGQQYTGGQPGDNGDGAPTCGRKGNCERDRSNVLVLCQSQEVTREAGRSVSQAVIQCQGLPQPTSLSVFSKRQSDSDPDRATFDRIRPMPNVPNIRPTQEGLGHR